MVSDTHTNTHWGLTQTRNANTHGHVARRQADVHTQSRTGPSSLLLARSLPLSPSVMRTHLHRCNARGEL